MRALGFDRKLNFHAAAIDQSAGGHHAPTDFFLQLEWSRVLTHQWSTHLRSPIHVIGAQKKSATQAHHAAGIALGKNCGTPPAAPDSARVKNARLRGQ